MSKVLLMQLFMREIATARDDVSHHDLFYGIEEVVGSIPSGSTTYWNIPETCRSKRAL
jgi:hypothetical protein